MPGGAIGASAKAWMQEKAWYLGEVGGRGKALRLAGVCTTGDTAGCKPTGLCRVKKQLAGDKTQARGLWPCSM